MRLRPLFALLLLAAPTVAWAEEDLSCRNGLFPSEPPFALAEVHGGERAYFHGDMNGCPWTGGACSSPSYVVPGDQMIISKIRDGYVCAFYPSEGGGTAGWVPSRQLRLRKLETNPPLSAWLGTWSSEGNPEIYLTARHGILRVEGEAFWPGPVPTERYPSPQIGSLDGPLNRTGHTASYSDDNLCKVKLTLLGDLMVAGDNSNCGGMNVSFSAVYRRVGE